MVTRTLGSITLALCALGARGSSVTVAQPSVPPVVPLAVVSVWPEAARKVTFTLRNDSDKVVTAWHVRYVDAAGSEKSGGLGRDAYAGYERARSRARSKPTHHIDPRGTTTATINLPDAVDDVVITPVLVVWKTARSLAARKMLSYLHAARCFARRLGDSG